MLTTSTVPLHPTQISAFAAVPAAGLAAGIKAAEWAGAALAVVGGKAGGKDDAAMGSASVEPSHVPAIIAAGTAFATGKL